ncbi:hypothetical protein D3C86_284040 [compost metagenome]
MNKSLIVISLLSVFALAPAIAQHHGQAQAQGHHAAGNSSPYAGMQSRAIKAMSDEQIAALKAGTGMALAMPAEVNGYPGPSHTLEMASELQLSQEQKTRTQQLFADMQAQAKSAGHEVIEAERELDALFRDKKATPETVSSSVSKAAMTQGKLRETHLRYHLAMLDVLTPEQVAAYSKLRGY